MVLPNYQRRRLTEFLVKCALDDELPDEIRAQALVSLAKLRLNTGEIVNQVLAVLRVSNKEEVRQGLYYFLYNSDYLDENIDVFLEGVKLTTSYDVERHLNIGIEKATSAESVKKIVTYFMNNPKDLKRRYLDSERCISSIAKNAADVYQDDAEVFALVTGLFIALVMESLNKESSLLTRFFDQTGTRLRAFQAIFAERAKIKYPAPILATLADPECLQFFAQQYVEGNVSENEVWQFQQYLGHKNRDLYLPFNKLINEKSGNRFEFQEGKDTDSERKQRLRDDVNLLFDKQAFIEEIKRVFYTEKKEALTADDLVDIAVEHWQESYFSDLALYKLRDIADYKSTQSKNAKEGKVDESTDEGAGESSEAITLEIALAEIHKWDWDWFTISKIYDYFESNRDVELTQEQKDWIANWCISHLNQVDFKKALVTKADGATASHLAIYLWYFAGKLRLEYPEEVLLDLLSFDWVEGHQMRGIGYIEDQLSKSIITKRILENLKAGIENNDVLENHIDYCRRNRILDVVPFALPVIADTKRAYFVRDVALKTVLELS